MDSPFHVLDFGTIEIPPSVIKYADTIKLENYKTNTPKNFQKHPSNVVDSDILLNNLAEIISIDDTSRLDYVFFSACNGAETHTDLLDPTIFSPFTYVVPV